MSTTATEVEFDPKAALKRGIIEIKAKAIEVGKNRDYYDGNHPRLEWIDKIKKVFGQTVADQVHVTNYCEKAIDAPLSRMAVVGFSDPTAEELFAANNLYQSQDDLYFEATLAGEGFVVVAESGPEDGPDAPPYEIVVQRAEDCHVEPGSLKPNDRKFAVKVWADPDYGEEGAYRAQVWDAFDYYRFISEGDPEKREIPSADGFTEDPEDPFGPHGFEKVPMVGFKRRRDPRSRLASLRPIQDRIDMLEIEKVIAGLFGASRQRVFFTHQELSEGDTESSPDFAIVLDPGNNEDGKASVTEFDYTPLDNYDDGIEAEIDRFYEIGDLPKHGRSNPGADASGEAIKAEEGPFTSMISGWTGAFNESWVEVFDLLGIETEVVWKDPETRNEKTQIDTVKVAVDAGMPLEMACKKYADFTEDDIAELRKAMAAKAAEDAAAREAAMQAQDQGRDPDEVIESNFE